MDNTFRNLVLCVCNRPDYYIILLNDGLAHIERTRDSYIFVHDVMGFNITLDEIKNIHWLGTDVLLTFECNKGKIELRLLRKCFCQCYDFCGDRTLIYS